MSYVDEFLKLRCAGDIINAVMPVQNFAKEISEAMSIRRALRKIVLQRPMEYRVDDLCAGNALSGILAAFSLPIKMCFAVDKKLRHRPGFINVKRWRYVEKDIFQINPEDIWKGTILISSYACKELALQIIKIFNLSNAAALIMLPCCCGEMKNLPIDLLDQNHISKYDQWCMYLYNQVVHEHSLKTKKLYRDDRVLSPCRNVLVAVREDRDLFIDSEYSNKE